jgi:HPt (histidine-containing phosphotransfer) domain-containing protein/CheY-like chemotaxis protein
MNKLRVLVVNSDGQEAERLAGRLASADHAALPATGLEEASEALVVQKFDAVLLGSELPADAVQEFTAKLRELERFQRSAAPAPVLSISAQVPDGAGWCAGERGIDAYLAESFQPPALQEAVTNLAASLARCGEPAANIRPELPVLEIERFREQVGRDENLMREIIDLFLAEAPAQVSELREAIAAGDFERSARTAHTIKGSLATLHAQQARSDAHRLESASRAANIAQCRESLECLEHDLEILEPQLLSLRASSARG